MLGRSICELCLTNLRLIDVFSGEIVDNAEIFVDQGKIVDAGCECKAQALKTIDLSGAIVAPGFIDAHVHIESSMLSPVQFARLIAPCGTTTIVSDPHEIANVLGMAGIRYMMREAKKAEINVFFMLPSCVPATPFETSGASLSAKDLVELIDDPEVLGLAELMNVPGFLANNADILKKVEMTLRHHKLVDGHSPLTAGAELSAYAGGGITSDHECSTEKEALDRIRRGMTVFMREGSAGQNVSALAGAVTERNSRFFCLCTDDASADDVYAKGHINNVIRCAVASSIDPLDAIRMATLNPALHFGLKGKGAIAPGYDADFVVLEDLQEFRVQSTWIGGREAARGGQMLTPEPKEVVAPEALATVHIRSPKEYDLTISSKAGKARVIGIRAGDLVTDHLIETVKTDAHGCVVCKNNPGLLKLAVIERHQSTGNIGLGLVKGFVQEGMSFNGAIASTIAHDSHNIVVIGDNDVDMYAAIEAIKIMQGGVVLVRDSQVIESLPLEIAGLMTVEPALKTAKRKSRLIETAHRQFNVKESVHPVMTLSFLPLAVIPHLRVTDKGLFDAVKFLHVNIDPSD